MQVADFAEAEELLDHAAVCPCIRTQGRAKPLIDDWDALWTFVRIEGVAPTNNEAGLGQPSSHVLGSDRPLTCSC